MLAQLSCVKFLDKLASNDPVPGGGSVAALSAGISASLAAMVANLTIGKKKYVEVEEEMTGILNNMLQMKDAFVSFIDQDANSFDDVMKAFKLPKETDDEKANRALEIEESYKLAASVPLAVAKSAAEMFPLIEAVVVKGNANAVTDGLIAAMMCRTAILGALLNVKINLTGIKDADYVKKVGQEIKDLEVLAVRREAEIMALVSF